MQKEARREGPSLSADKMSGTMRPLSCDQGPMPFPQITQGDGGGGNACLVGGCEAGKFL